MKQHQQMRYKPKRQKYYYNDYDNVANEKKRNNRLNESKPEEIKIPPQKKLKQKTFLIIERKKK